MNFDPDKHHRRSIRLQEYDYRQPGAYFITICTQNKACCLGTVSDGVITLSRSGLIVEKCWLNLPHNFPYIELDAYVIMPNHLHGILLINSECRGQASAPRSSSRQSNLTADASPKAFDVPHHRGTKANSLSAIVQNFKSITSRRIKLVEPAITQLWQRNYYEHVIRNAKSLDEIREYIASNPWNWHLDEYNPSTYG